MSLIIPIFLFVFFLFFYGLLRFLSDLRYLGVSKYPPILSALVCSVQMQHMPVSAVKKAKYSFSKFLWCFSACL